MTSEITVIGGGLAGLINAILLSRKGHSVTLFEKKKYPFHRVCGEYISNEVIPFLKREELYPEGLEPAQIKKFRLSSIGGRTLDMPLDLGGFGVSRYDYDHWLVRKAETCGVDIRQGSSVEDVTFGGGSFTIKARGGDQHHSPVVIGAFGKKSNLDHTFKRNFTRKRHPFIGVKYHVMTDQVDPETIELHNFPGGYCGISRVGKDRYNMCYLSTRNNLRLNGNIEDMEDRVLKKNPHLRRILDHSDKLFDQPAVINEITFEKKEAVKDHVLMSGDAAGMITPLCGNGMAMAIHSAYLLSQLLSENLPMTTQKRSNLERNYTRIWHHHFATRHWAGRKIQTALFGSRMTSGVAIGLGNTMPLVAQYLMKQTHGRPF